LGNRLQETQKAPGNQGLWRSIRRIKNEVPGLAVCYIALTLTLSRRERGQNVTPTGAEHTLDSTGNSGALQVALQTALQIADPTGVAEAVGRLTPEERAALLVALGNVIH